MQEIMLLHGTSIETINLLALNWKIPDTRHGFYFFTPVINNFLSTKYAISLKTATYSLKQSLEISKF